jgi:hypothetical protein
MTALEAQPWRAHDRCYEFNYQTLFSEELAMLTILLIVLIVMMFGGWGYGRRSGGSYGNPMGVVGLLLVIVLIAILFWAIHV